MANKQPIIPGFTLSDLFSGIKKNLTAPMQSPAGPGFSPSVRTLPNDGGQYSTPVPNMSFAKDSPYVTQKPPVVATPPPSVGGGGIKPKASPAATPAPSNQNVPQQWINPKTGQFYTPAEIANNIAAVAPGAGAVNGDVPKFAGDTLTEGPQTAEQLQSTAAGLNNSRNDIAVGETDPYKVASESGIAYTPAELKAIESAYAGVYDPAINSALAKLDVQQKKDAEDRAFENDLKKMDKQFEYDRKLKLTAAPGSGGTSISSGVYTPGANPAVDAWAQRIFDGSAKITDIPASQKGMRDAVVVALQASGNDLSGKPTTTELGKSAKTAAAALLAKLKAGTGTSAVGKSRIFGGSLAIPGSDKSNFVIDFQNLKDLLSLDGVKYLKGQGSVSDSERALLQSAVTKLNLSQSEDDFGTTLQGIIDKLNGVGDGGGASSQPATMILNGKTLTRQADGTYE